MCTPVKYFEVYTKDQSAKINNLIQEKCNMMYAEINQFIMLSNLNKSNLYFQIIAVKQIHSC